MQFLKIILLAVAAAVVYGIVHDQITVRVCLEYFTVAHPPIFGGTQSPTLLAFGWGVIATWWVGLPLGVLLALAARVGGLPKLTAKDLLIPMFVGLLILGAAAMLAGYYGCMHASMTRDWARLVPPEHRKGFAFDEGAHLASYVLGAILGMVLSIWTIIKRATLARAAMFATPAS
jgi:hypothetical protein